YLANAADAFQDAECTWVANHHCKQLHPCSRPPQLSDLAYPSTGGFFRQWLLVNRRHTYLTNGKHQLAVRVGGNAGHASLWAIDLDEGLTDDAPTKLDARVQPLDQVKAQAANARPAARVHTHVDRKVLEAVAALAPAHKHVTCNRVCQHAGLSTQT